MSDQLLTIAIPTFNRAEYLDLCLMRISEELDSLSADWQKLVTVYVSNNASTDNTDKVISRYEFKNLRAFKVVNNADNIGADRNIVQCYTSATTPYVWILGDDDVILPGKLRVILNILKKEDIDILYVNGYGYSNSYLSEPKRGRGKTGVSEYSSALDFVRRTHIMLTFISALIVRSSIRIEIFRSLVEGSNLSQLSWVFTLVRDGRKFVIVEDRVYAGKIANSGGYGAIEIFGNNLSSIADNFFMERPRLAEAIKNGAIVTWFPAYIINSRSGESYGFLKENIGIDLQRLFGENWRYHFFLRPLIFLPIVCARLYFLFIRLVRKTLGMICI